MASSRNSDILWYGFFPNIEELKYLTEFFEENNKRILCISTEYTRLSTLRVLQYLEFFLKIVDVISINLKEILSSEECKKTVLQDFELQTSDLLIIECENTTEQEQDEVQDLYTQLIAIINKCDRKKIILIIQSNILAKSFECDFQNINLYVQIRDTFDLNGFNAHRKLYEKEISFQGITTSFNQLMIENLETVTDETFKRLICQNVSIEILNNERLEVGSRPLGVSDLKGAYAELFININTDTLIDVLLKNDSNNIYIISGMNSRLNENFQQKLIQVLNINQNQFYLVFNQINILTISNKKYSLPNDHTTEYKKIYLVDDQFKEEHFKLLCDDNSNKKIYWIKFNGSKLILQMVYDFDFYITRKFNQVNNVEIKNEVYDTVETINLVLTQETRDSFIFTGITDDDYQELGNLLDFDGELFNKKRIFIKQTIEESKKKFDELDGTVHWLEIQKIPRKKSFLFEKEKQYIRKIIWRDSKGSLIYLRKYIDKKQIKKVDETSLVESIMNKQVVIISGDPGSGKSTSLIKLCASNEIFTKNWIINVNLKDHLKAIKEIEPNNVHVTEFLAKIHPNLNNHSAKMLLDLVLNKSKHFKKTLLITFDGFNEVINKSDKDKVVALLKALKYHSKAKFWITTRIEHQKILEDDLCTFAIEFEPLKREEQKKLIKKYLKSRLSLVLSKNRLNIFENDGNIKMEMFSDAFVENIDSLRFIAEPLLLFLQLETSKTQEDSEGNLVMKSGIELFKNWIDGNYELDVDYLLSRDILEIYESFINGKYETYFKKVGIVEEEIKDAVKKYNNDYFENLAKLLILSLKSNKPLEDFKTINFSSVVIKSDNNNLTFRHSTFGEYFLSKVCINWIKNQSDLPNGEKQTYLLIEILANKNYKVIRAFINDWLKDKLKSASKSTLPKEVLRQYGEIIKSWLEDGETQSNERYKSIYIAAKEGNANIITFIVRCVECSCKNIVAKSLSLHYLKNHIEETDNEGNNSFHIACLNGHDAAIKALLELLQTDPEYFKEFVKKKNGLEKTIFHYLGDKNNTEMVKNIINAIRPRYRVEVLMSPANKLFGYDSLILDLCSSKHVQVIETFLKCLEKNERVEIILQRYLIDLALQNHWTKFTKYLINQLLNNCVKEKTKLPDLMLSGNNKGYTILMTASEFNEIDIVKKLLACVKTDANRSIMLMLNENNKLNSLHVAARNNSAGVIRILLKAASDISEDAAEKLITSVNKNGKNALNLAIYNDCYEVVKVLLSTIKDISAESREKLIFSTDEEGMNVFYYAVYLDRYRMVKELLTLAKDISNQCVEKLILSDDKKGISVFHFAVNNNNEKIVEELLSTAETISKEIAEKLILSKNKKEMNALHIAVYHKYNHLAEYLLAAAKNISINTFKELIFSAGERGKNALHYAACNMSPELIHKLLNAADDISVDKAIELIKSVDDNKNNVLFHVVDDKNLTSFAAVIIQVMNRLLNIAEKYTRRKKLSMDSDSNIISQLIFHENNEKINVIVHLLHNDSSDDHCLKDKVKGVFEYAFNYPNIWNRIQKEIEDALPIQKKKKFCNPLVAPFRRKSF